MNKNKFPKRLLAPLTGAMLALSTFLPGQALAAPLIEDAVSGITAELSAAAPDVEPTELQGYGGGQPSEEILADEGAASEEPVLESEEANVSSRVLSADAGTTFDLVVDVLEWGSAVTAVIIDAQSAVKSSDLATDTFAVSAITRNPTNNNVVYNGPRTVTKAYASATKEKGKPADEGRYIVLELKYGYNATGAEVDGSAAIYYQSRNYWMDMEYTVVPKGTASGVADAGLIYTRTIRPAYDSFKLYDNPVDGFTGQKYRMYVPESAKQGKALPLVLWNHGGGETYGTAAGGAVNNEGAQLFANMGGLGWVKNAPEDAYVLVPQRSFSGYSRAGVVAFVRDLIAKGEVDGNRIYVSGCSAGGSETHNYLLEHPNFFAAAVPVCPASGGNLSVAQLDAIKHIPTWYIHAATDRTVAPANSQTPYERLLALKARDARRTLFPYVFGTEIPNADYANANYPDGHWSWVMLLNNEYVADGGVPGYSKGTKIMDWLFAQSKAAFADLSSDAQYGAYYNSGEGDMAEGAVMIVAQYDAKGKMISSSYAALTAHAPHMAFVDKTAESASAKAFLWDARFAPMSDPLELVARYPFVPVVPAE